MRESPGSHSNPLWTFWRDPRATIRSVIESDPLLHVIPIAWLVGVGGVLETWQWKSKLEPGWGPFVVGMAVIMGPLFGFGHVYVRGALVGMTGRWLGGQATNAEARAAIAWAGLPEVLGLIVSIAAIATFGLCVFEKNGPYQLSAPLHMAFNGVLLLQVALMVWSYFIGLKCLAEVHGFSTWRAFWAVALSWLIPLLSLVAIALMIPS